MAAHLVAFAVQAAEVADFAHGNGTNGWAISDSSFVSPTYQNDIGEISVVCSGETMESTASVWATSAGGVETKIATFTAASSGATFTFGNMAGFRSFRIELSAGMQLLTFAVVRLPSFRAFPFSGLSGNSYGQDFDSLAAITATSGGKEWLNGTTIPCWQAWKGDSEVVSLNYNGGKIRTGGLYALAANQKDGQRAFGGYSSKDAPITWGMAFTNDTDTALGLVGVSYSAQQWGFSNTNEHSLSFACLVTNRMDWIANFSDGWRSCCDTMAKRFGEDDAHPVPVTTLVEYSPESTLRVEPGEVLLFRWSVNPPTGGYSALMAIDDLVVTFARDARPFTIHLVYGGMQVQHHQSLSPPRRNQ